MTYTVKRVRSRAIRIHVHADGRVVVTAPMRVAVKAIERFVTEKQEWIVQAQQKTAGKKKSILHTATAEEYKKYKQAAMALAAKRLQHFNAHYGFTYRRLTIRNSKTRWGSCSRQGSVSFSYTIVLLSPALADYIIVHELCHTKEFNHSPRFWGLVAETIPDYKECKRLLKDI